MKVCCVVLLALLAVLPGQAQQEEVEARGKNGACTNTGPKPSPALFKQYTKPGKKGKHYTLGHPALELNLNFLLSDCPCWWNMSLKICACCVGDAVQCGFPQHKFCYKRTPMGCPGVCNNKYTLSERGFPCYNDKTQ